MDEVIRVMIDPEVEAYPVLSIRELDPRVHGSHATGVEIPAVMYGRLNDAYAAVDEAEMEIMRYVAERYRVPVVQDWVAERTTDG